MNIENIQFKIITKFGVTAYDCAGYGDNRSREDFKTAGEAVAYAKSLPPNFGARAWKQRIFQVDPQSETLWTLGMGDSDG